MSAATCIIKGVPCLHMEDPFTVRAEHTLHNTLRLRLILQASAARGALQWRAAAPAACSLLRLCTGTLLAAFMGGAASAGCKAEANTTDLWTLMHESFRQWASMVMLEATLRKAL